MEDTIETKEVVVKGLFSSVVNTTNHAYVQGCVNLLDCLVLVMPCPNCGIEGRLVFSKALQVQEIRCTRCNSSVSFRAVGHVLHRLEEDFEDVQNAVTENGGWIDISIP